MDKNLSAYRAITDGVTGFRTRCAMSNIRIEKDSTFPILTGTGGNFIDSIREKSVSSAVGGFLGKGRYIAFAHEGNFSKDSDISHNADLLRQNILTWLGGGFRNKRIGFTHGHSEWLQLKDFSESLLKWGEEKSLLFENISGNDLSLYDVIIIGNPWKKFSAEEVSSLIKYAEEGGGLLILSVGWSWADHKNDEECVNLPVNELGESLGFKFERGGADHNYNIGDTFALVNNPKPLEIIKADGKSNEEIAALLAADDNTVYALEGEYVILHLTNELWKKVKAPGRIIDNLDLFYSKEYDFMGRISHPYEGKLWYITNVGTQSFMYMSGDHCGMSSSGAEHFVKKLEGGDNWQTAFAGWGFGHEVGHAMVNKVCGGLFQPSGTGESWNNVINIYAHKELGYYDVARNQGLGYPHNYYGDDRKYARFNGVDYDLLPEGDRDYDILLSNSWIFLKLPMLMVDYYGWHGIEKLFQTAALDAKNGVSMKSNEDRIEYLIVNLSKSYGLDLTFIFEHWKFPVTEKIKEQLKELPKEEILRGIYNGSKDFDKYTAYLNESMATN